MRSQSGKTDFAFREFYWPYCDRAGNFLLVRKGNVPLAAVRIDRDGGITRLENLSKLGLWPGSCSRQEECLAGNSEKSFLLHDSAPEKDHRQYELFRCGDIENSAVIGSERIDRYTVSPDGRCLVFSKEECPGDITLCCYDIVEGKTLWETRAPAEKPVWGFCMDKQNDLYLCGSEGVSKLGGADGAKLWSAPVRLNPAAGATGVRLTLGDGFASVSYLDHAAGAPLLRAVLIDTENGRCESAVPYRLQHTFGVCLPDVFAPINANGNTVWRAVTEGRGSTVVKLDRQEKKWDAVGYSSVMYPRKLLACKDGAFIVAGGDGCAKVEKITGEQREMLFSRRVCSYFDCLLSPEGQFGIYLEETNKSRFWRI